MGAGLLTRRSSFSSSCFRWTLPAGEYTTDNQCTLYCRTDLERLAAGTPYHSILLCSSWMNLSSSHTVLGSGWGYPLTATRTPWLFFLFQLLLEWLAGTDHVGPGSAIDVTWHVNRRMNDTTALIFIDSLKLWLCTTYQERDSCNAEQWWQLVL